VIAPGGVMDVFLQPGDFFFADELTRIRTLLGSCVAITLWHPHRRIGGMCHYMLPSRARPDPAAELDGRYADEAVALFLDELSAARTSPQDYVVKIFGGGRQFTEWAPAAGMRVADRNVEVGLELLAAHRLPVTAQHLGGTGHRQVILDLWTGDVWVKHVDRTGPGPRTRLHAGAVPQGAR
jgi:chemotaxis protein CheD